MVLQGLIGAGLAEEFSRFVMQSRFEKVYHSVGLVFYLLQQYGLLCTFQFGISKLSKNRAKFKM
jgi:hypothetical protein